MGLRSVGGSQLPPPFLPKGEKGIILHKRDILYVFHGQNCFMRLMPRCSQKCFLLSIAIIFLAVMFYYINLNLLVMGYINTYKSSINERTPTKSWLFGLEWSLLIQVRDYLQNHALTNTWQVYKMFRLQIVYICDRTVLHLRLNQ